MNKLKGFVIVLLLSMLFQSVLTEGSLVLAASDRSDEQSPAYVFDAGGTNYALSKAGGRWILLMNGKPRNVNLGRFVKHLRRYRMGQWKSSNPKVASVNKKGIVRIKKEGNVTISVKPTIGKRTLSRKFRIVDVKKWKGKSKLRNRTDKQIDSIVQDYLDYKDFDDDDDDNDDNAWDDDDADDDSDNDDDDSDA